VTLVINPVVGCCYFPPGSQLLSQPISMASIKLYCLVTEEHRLSSLPKATMQWRPARTQTRDL